MGARGGEPHPELDVLDRRLREPLLVESADALERVASNGADAAPERRRGPGRGLVDMVVEQVSEDRDDALRFRTVVVGTEERREVRIGREGATDPANASGWISMSASTKTSTSPDASRAPAFRAAAGPGSIGISNDDDLFRTVVCSRDRVGADRSVRGRSSQGRSLSSETTG